MSDGVNAHGGTVAMQELLGEVKRAGQLLKESWPGAVPVSESGLEIRTKEDGSFVTSADFASNDHIVSNLQRLFPNDLIFSEELPFSKDFDNAERVWVLDPLDGTKYFIEGRDDFAILLALKVKGEYKFGIMYFPIRDLLAMADADSMSATLNGEKLLVSSASTSRPQKVYVRNCKVSQEEAYFDGSKYNSGIALLELCKGDLDGVIIKMTQHGEYDVAPVIPMLQAAGGRVSDEFGNPVRFSNNKPNSGFVVASNGKVHEALLAYCRKV